jgi:hypothetical protein
MHPSVHLKARAKCPICGMDLVPMMKKGEASGSSTVQVSQFTADAESRLPLTGTQRCRDGRCDLRSGQSARLSRMTEGYSSI